MTAVLFVSNHSLERDENLRAVWDAYDGPKVFMRGVDSVAGVSGKHPVVVCDTLMPYDPNKRYVIVNIGHGVTGGKLYGNDEQRAGIDPRALAQTDYAISTSKAMVPTVARRFGIPEDRVLPFGMPRTDWYKGKLKGDGGTLLADYRRAYLYAPTFRGPNDGDRLPSIDWARVDGLLEDNEVLVVKRHYYTRNALVDRQCEKVVEVPYDEPSAAYLMDCDVIATDYSSIVLDAYILGKPSVLLMEDMEVYLSTRGMYLEYPTSYGSRWLRAEGNEQRWVEHMRAAVVTGMRGNERRCREVTAGMCDGHASERVAEFIGGLL